MNGAEHGDAMTTASTPDKASLTYGLLRVPAGERRRQQQTNLEQAGQIQREHEEQQRQTGDDHRRLQLEAPAELLLRAARSASEHGSEQPERNDDSRRECQAMLAHRRAIAAVRGETRAPSATAPGTRRASGSAAGRRAAPGRSRRRATTRLCRGVRTAALAPRIPQARQPRPPFRQAGHRPQRRARLPPKSARRFEHAGNAREFVRPAALATGSASVQRAPSRDKLCARARSRSDQRCTRRNAACLMSAGAGAPGDGVKPDRRPSRARSRWRSSR